jgi:hypothetical protein
MSQCDLLFLDPDNGIATKGVSLGSDMATKFVFPEDSVAWSRNRC